MVLATGRSSSIPPRRRARSSRTPGALIAIGLLSTATITWLVVSGLERGAAAPAPANVAPADVASSEGRGPTAASAGNAKPERLRVRVLRSWPHDPRAYTQGLLWEGDAFLESAGGYGESLVRRWRPGQARPLAEVRLPDRVFAEGLAAVGERVIQLSWREGLAFYRDRDTLNETARVPYQGEGWGLCFDGERLIMSDGSDRLTYRDSESFAPLRVVEVRAGGEPLGDLNELECAEGWVYANVYETDEIARIDPASGRVAAVIDASGLLTAEERAAGAEVLNGIAYNPDTETFYLTGKLWPRLFEVVFEPTSAPLAHSQ